MAIWKNTSGKILKAANGKILACDECPCSQGGPTIPECCNAPQSLRYRATLGIQSWDYDIRIGQSGYDTPHVNRCRMEFGPIEGTLWHAGGCLYENLRSEQWWRDWVDAFVADGPPPPWVEPAYINGYLVHVGCRIEQSFNEETGGIQFQPCYVSNPFIMVYREEEPVGPRPSLYLRGAVEGPSYRGPDGVYDLPDRFPSHEQDEAAGWPYGHMAFNARFKYRPTPPPEENPFEYYPPVTAEFPHLEQNNFSAFYNGHHGSLWADSGNLHEGDSFWRDAGCFIGWSGNVRVIGTMTGSLEVWEE